MDENFESYNNQWFHGNNFHQAPINETEIPVDQFFMDPAGFMGVSRSPDETIVNLPKEDGSNNSTAFVEYISPKEISGKPSLKRRTRASRRTPPTLLNANVKNFRDLVQQYTGCESCSSIKNQKGPINLKFGSSNDQRIDDHSVEIPDFDGRYEQRYSNEYGQVNQRFM